MIQHLCSIQTIFSSISSYINDYKISQNENFHIFERTLWDRDGGGVFRKIIEELETELQLSTNSTKNNILVSTKAKIPHL